MAWNEAVITNTGLGLLAAAVESGLTIAGAAGGEEYCNPVGLLNLNEIAGTKHALNVAKKEVIDKGLRITVRIQNEGLAESYVLRQIGLYTESGELFAVIQDRDGEIIPAKEENPEFLVEFGFVIPLSNADKVSVNITPDTFATMEDMNQVLNPEFELPEDADSVQEPESGESIFGMLGKLAGVVKAFVKHRALQATDKISGHVRLFNGSTVTEDGYAADARQLNPDIEGTLADKTNKLALALESRVPQFHYGTKNTISGGWYKININSAHSWMLSFTIRLYQDYKYSDILISGYNYSNDHWYSPKADLIASSVDSMDIIFGYDDTWLLWVAVPAGSYTGLTILDINNGFEQTDNWSSQFSVAYMATLTGTVQTTVTAYRPVKVNETVGNADTVDGHHFHWSGQSGQPAWLWGGNESANQYVYNPSNFSVNYANSAGSATKATQDGSGNVITSRYVVANDEKVVAGMRASAPTYSVAIGDGTVAQGAFSVSIGGDAQSYKYATAVGVLSTATSKFSTAFGYHSSATGEDSISIGSSEASGEGSIAIGRLSKATGHRSTALGFWAEASGDRQLQLGNVSELSSLTCRVGLTVTSDERDKTDITDLDNVTEFLRKIRTVRYVTNPRSLYIAPERPKPMEYEQIPVYGYTEEGAPIYEPMTDDDGNALRTEPVDYEQGRAIYSYDEDGLPVYTYDETIEYLSEEDEEKRSKYGMCKYDREAHAAGTKKGERIRVGVLAGQIQELLLEIYGDIGYANLVNDSLFDYDKDTIPEDVESQLGVTYDRFIPFLIKGFQEMSDRQDAMDRRASELEEENRRLSGRVETLEKHLGFLG